jgi:hypothetical protein
MSDNHFLEEIDLAFSQLEIEATGSGAVIWVPQRQAALVSLPRRAAQAFRSKVEPSWQESQRLFYA